MGDDAVIEATRKASPRLEKPRLSRSFALLRRPAEAHAPTRSALYPIRTVGQPIVMTPPCDVGSPIRAAIRLPISTVGEPMAIISGGPTHVHISVARAAGWPPISTVGQPGGKIGPPTWGTGGVPGVTIGHVCMSPILAAGGILFLADLVYIRSLGAHGFLS
jgi:hypothetical protein